MELGLMYAEACAPVGTMFPQALSFYELSAVAIILLAPLFIISCRRRSPSDHKTRILPSPRGLPIIGNLHQIGSLPHRSLRALSEKHGPLMLLHMGRIPTLIVSSADAAREIMRTHDLIFASRPSPKVGRILAYGCEDLIFSRCSEHWRQLRKICVTHLLSNKMVKSFQRMRREEVAIMIDKVSSQSSAGSSTVDMSEVLSSFANDVICRVVSGKFSMEAGRNRVFREMIDENTRLFSSVAVEDYFPSFGWLDDLFGLTKGAERNRRRWDGVLEQVISDHADGKRGDDGFQEGGFVNVLLSLQNDPEVDFALSKHDIKAILWDMFGAGTDTSYILLEWTMAELVRSPEAMKKLQDEVRGAAKGKPMVGEEELGELRYLRAVLMEVLRLHPPVPVLIPRESMEDCEICGYKVPKQTRVLINAWAIGRDPMNWEASEEFRPERFIGSPIDFKGNDFQFTPFGAGRRICPGMNFAVATSELAVANLICMFNWELPGGTTMDMAESPGISTYKKKRLELLAKPYAC